ncbi:caspase family protein [Verrucosispora sp. TAA-831]|uniref:caspase family protein n=1 Tax=Verrucosispora sp. TAA-831 TaxID=3422227 RepID=UPI003D6FBFAA
MTIATATYEDPTWEDLPGVHDEVAVLRDWLCAEHLTDRRFELRWPELADDPTEDDIRGRLKHLARDRVWTDADAAVLYVTGHGVEADSTHYLILRKSVGSMLATTALRTSDLISWLADTPIHHLLIIIDACYAGQVAHDAMRLSRQLHRRWLILPSVTRDEKAVTGALTSAIVKFLDALREPEGRRYGEGPYIDVAAFVQDVQEHLGPGQSLYPLYGGQLAGPHVCLPNPHHQRSAVLEIGPARHELALPKQELETHWSPRSRGVATGEQAGWLFTGRGALMRKLIAAATSWPRVTVISGGAGSGKSAVLARLVTLSDRQFAEEYAEEIAAVPAGLRPPLDAVDVAVLATGKLHTQILKQICDALRVPPPETGSPEPTVDQRLASFHAWLNSRVSPITVVIDALDEATDPVVLVREVLAFLEPDPANPKIRLLIGVRSLAAPNRAAHVGPSPAAMPLADLAESVLQADRIPVDEAPWWDQRDVVAYVQSILTRTRNSPYASVDIADTAGVAGAVGTRAARSFLVARIAASSLAGRQKVIQADDPSWLKALDDGLLGVFRDDLHNSIASAADRHRAVVLMRAVAFAFGAGLPWRGLWPLVASAVDEDGGQYGDSDIVALLNSRLGAYLITDRDNGMTVYRLFHDSLRSTFRDRWRELLRAPNTI